MSYVCRATTAPSRPAANNLQSRWVIFDDGCSRTITKFRVAEITVDFHKPAAPPAREVVLSLLAANLIKAAFSMATISHNTVVSKYGVCRPSQTETFVADYQYCR